MRPILIVLTGISVMLVVWHFAFQNPKKNTRDNNMDMKFKNKIKASSPTPAPYTGEVDKSVFIPYWKIPLGEKEVHEFDTLIYFGIATDQKGNIVQDLGLQNIEKFVTRFPKSKKRLLTLRMTNDKINTLLLDAPDLQDKVIQNTHDLVKKYDFDGIVLDLEVGMAPFEDVKNSITSFIKKFNNFAIEKNKSFSITIYGDTYYRKRPYDIEAINKYVDEFYIMAYDFHKKRGEPGPNFPLTRRSESKGGQEEDYGYDFPTMIDDFTYIVPRDKITVLFGMYGYDWTLGPQGKPLKPAVAISKKEIEEGIVSKCEKNSCVISENKLTHEKKITYKDDEGYDHIIWYEDTRSSDLKIEYLKEKGIGSVGYWVWGYW